jgi:hypothetical protein
LPNDGLSRLALLFRFREFLGLIHGPEAEYSILRISQFYSFSPNSFWAFLYKVAIFFNTLLNFSFIGIIKFNEADGTITNKYTVNVHDV